MDEGACRAVGGERVVEAGPRVQLVHRLDVVEEDPADIGARRPQPVDVDVLLGLPVVRAHPDQVPLVGHDVHQLVLLEEAGDRGVALSPPLRVSIEMAR
jgi:hypothetical protein